MLTRNQASNIDPGAPEEDVLISFEEFLAIARRQAVLVAALAFACTVLGLSYSFLATPLYTASAKVLIDSPSDQLNFMNPFGDAGPDNATILSQVELIRSEKVIGTVVDRLGLIETSSDFEPQPEIATPADGLPSGPAGNSLNQANSEPLASNVMDEEATRRMKAIARTSSLLDVKRMGMTYILNIQYTDPNPERAAAVVNAIANEYMAEQVAVRFETARKARDWLKVQIAELSAEAEAADLAVQQFRVRNQMVTVDGRRVDEQQLGELNSQLVTAMGATSQAEAKFNRIESIIASGDVRSLVTEALGSSIIIDLRQKYLAVNKQASELKVLVGDRHTRVLALLEEMRRYEAQIFEELQRIRESARSELDIARQAQADLQAKVKSMSSVSLDNNETLVELKALEDRASTARAMLLTLLQRDQEAQQGQSYSMNEARVVSVATPPVTPSYPKKSVLTLASLMIGLMVGAGAGYLREVSDRTFRNGRQVQRLLGLPLICAVPFLNQKKSSGKSEKSRLSALDEPIPDRRDADEPSDLLTDYAVTAPMSGFAEALRSIKLSVDLAPAASGGRVVGFSSCNPGEGKSTLSKNFASLLSLSGFRTILIDADLRAHGLTRYVDRDIKSGLVEVLEGKTSLQSAMRSETASGLHLLLSVVNRGLFNSSEVVSSKAMRDLILKLRQSYDYVILDLPPMGPVVDGQAVAPLLDAVLLVIEWGMTPRHGVKTLLEAQRPIYERCSGVIFNKVDARIIHRYEYYGSRYYGYGRYGTNNYSSYYVEEAQDPKTGWRGVAMDLGLPNKVIEQIGHKSGQAIRGRDVSSHERAPRVRRSELSRPPVRSDFDQ